MYNTGDIVEGVVGVEPGTSLLVTGASQMSRGVVYDLLSEGFSSGEALVVIATDRNARQIVSELEQRSSAFDPASLGVIDTTGQSPDVESVAVEGINSAGDLTGISLGTAKVVRQLGGEDRAVRLGLVSISTVMMYVDLPTVFRFLHVFTSRVNSADWMGAFALDPEMHDAQAVSTIRAAFDAELLVDDDGITARGDGLVTR